MMRTRKISGRVSVKAPQTLCGFPAAFHDTVRTVNGYTVQVSNERIELDFEFAKVVAVVEPARCVLKVLDVDARPVVHARSVKFKAARVSTNVELLYAALIDTLQRLRVRSNIIEEK